MDTTESSHRSVLGIENLSSKLPPSVLSARKGNEHRAPLLRLPQEILYMILGLSASCPIYRRRDTPYSSERRARPRDRAIPWLYLGHICHKLRETLLSMRQLWAEVASLYSSRLDATQEVVRRAAGAPLTIIISHDPLLPDDSIEFFLSCMHRARHIEVASTRVLTKMLEEDSIQLPIVEKLILESRQIELEASKTLVVAPLLQSLHLLWTTLPVNTRHLRELRLLLPNPADAMWARYIVDTLGLCSRLHTLEIGEMRFAPMSTSTSPINLTFLRDFVMRGENRAVSWLWSQISVPSEAMVRAVIEGDLEDDPAVWETIVALAPHVHHRRDTRPISGFTFLLDPGEYLLSFRLFEAAEDPLTRSKEHHFSPFHRSHRCTLLVVAVCDDSIYSAHDHLTRLCDLFGLAEVENLHIGTRIRQDGMGRERIAGYNQWLTVFNNVRNLCLSHYSFPESHGDVLASPLQSEPELDFSLLCPQLRSLAILDPSLYEHELEHVVNMVAERAANGMPLQELKLAFDCETTQGRTYTDADDFASRSFDFRTILQNLVPSTEFELLKKIDRELLDLDVW